MKNWTLTAACTVGLLWAPFVAQAQRDCDVNGDAREMVTGNECDPALGRVQLGIDDMGATGSSTDGGRACYDPVDDLPDQGMVSTIFESMGYVCRSIGEATEGKWLDAGANRGVAVNSQFVDGVLTSEFEMLGLRVEGRFRLNCTILEKCYTFTNVSGQPMGVLALTHYMDVTFSLVMGALETTTEQRVGCPKNPLGV